VHKSLERTSSDKHLLETQLGALEEFLEDAGETLGDANDIVSDWASTLEEVTRYPFSSSLQRRPLSLFLLPDPRRASQKRPTSQG